MGAVKMETVNQGRGVHQWNNISLNSVDNIDSLIKLRSQFEDNYLCKNLYSRDIFKSNGIPKFVEIITCIYADLDIYIKKATLYPIERLIIKYLMLGCNYEDISYFVEKKLKLIYNISDLKRIYRNACRKILAEYKYSYKIWLESSEQIKIKSNKKFKKCNNCKKDLHRIYFRKKSTTKDGFNTHCRKCEAVRRYKPEVKRITT